MKKAIKHPAYGEIVYEEEIRSRKRIFTINGTTTQKISIDRAAGAVLGFGPAPALMG